VNRLFFLASEPQDAPDGDFKFYAECMLQTRLKAKDFVGDFGDVPLRKCLKKEPFGAFSFCVKGRTYLLWTSAKGQKILSLILGMAPLGKWF